MPKACLLLFSVLYTCLLQAQIPAYGSMGKLDIATWNVEWFGDASNGPSDDALQFSNVLNVFRESKIDVWALQEISDTNTFKQLIDSLPGYDGVLATYSQTQKIGFLYDTSLFRKTYSKPIITNQYYDFSSGRFPLELALISKNGSNIDTFIFINVHLKANVGNSAQKQESWQRRKNCAGHLKTYIDQTHPSKKVVVLGDFNDDTDTSIYNNNITPLDTILKDVGNYKFLTTSLSAAQMGSFVGFNDMIDHQIISNELFTSYESNSCKLLPLDNFITSYSSNTSDHYPVFAQYSFETISVNKVKSTDFVVYPNPLGANEKLKIENGELIGVYDTNGKEVNSSLFTSSTSNRQPGIFIIQIDLYNRVLTKRIVVQ